MCLKSIFQRYKKKHAHEDSYDKGHSKCEFANYSVKCSISLGNLFLRLYSLISWDWQWIHCVILGRQKAFFSKRYSPFFEPFSEANIACQKVLHNTDNKKWDYQISLESCPKGWQFPNIALQHVKMRAVTAVIKARRLPRECKWGRKWQWMQTWSHEFSLRKVRLVKKKKYDVLLGSS